MLLSTLYSKRTLKSFMFPQKFVRTLRVDLNTYFIPKSQIDLYIKNGFTVSKIAGVMPIRESTIRRRIRHFGLSTRESCTDMSDRIVPEFKSKVPCCD